MNKTLYFPVREIKTGRILYAEWSDIAGEWYEKGTGRAYSTGEVETIKGEIKISQNTWGGARSGAGRKPADPEDKRVQMVITIDRDTREKLKAISRARKIRIGRLIDEMVKGEW